MHTANTLVSIVSKELYQVRENPPKLSDSDFAIAADSIGCDIASIKAVAEVESNGGGFSKTGLPRILFEAHHFSRYTKGIYDATHANISSRIWNRELYKVGDAEYDRLLKAVSLDRLAALKSASWGMFQIMGSNYSTSGFKNVEAFVEAMFESEGKHLDAAVNFIKSIGAADALKRKNWDSFALKYNGSGYSVNNYHNKLRNAYYRIKG